MREEELRKSTAQYRCTEQRVLLQTTVLCRTLLFVSTQAWPAGTIRPWFAEAAHLVFGEVGNICERLPKCQKPSNLNFPSISQ